MVNNHIEDSTNTDNLITQDLSKGELMICQTNRDSLMLDPAHRNEDKIVDENIIIRMTKGLEE